MIKADLRQQIENFGHQESVLNAAQSTSRDLLLQTFGERSYWKTLLDEEKQEIYRALVDRVGVKDGKVERVELKV